MTDAPPPPSASSQTDRAVLTLREMILTGKFKAGERLTELGLVEHLRASRTPIRHALAKLAHEGLLEPFPTGGFRLRAFTLEEAWDTIELRGVLEGTAARLAAERLTDPSELAPMRAHVARMDAMLPITEERFVEYLELNETFHLEFRTLAKSRTLLTAIDGVLRLPFAAPGALVMSEARSSQSARTIDLAQQHHHAIVDAIASRAGTRAEHLAREHALLSRRALERTLQGSRRLSEMPGASLIAMSLAV